MGGDFEGRRIERGRFLFFTLGATTMATQYDIDRTCSEFTKTTTALGWSELSGVVVKEMSNVDAPTMAAALVDARNERDALRQEVESARSAFAAYRSALPTPDSEAKT